MKGFAGPLSREKIRVLRSLSSRKIRDRRKLCLVEGERSIAQCRASGFLEYLIAGPDLTTEFILSALGEAELTVPLYSMQPDLSGEISAVARSTGLIGVSRIPDDPVLNSFARNDPSSIMLFLDGVQESGNVGGLIRSAWGLGVRGVLLGPGCADPFSAKAVRASAGGVFSLPVKKSFDFDDLEKLAGSGWSVYLADSAGISVRNASFAGPLILVMGSEVSGLSPRLEVLGDKIAVPMMRGVDSLNVVVAGSIILERMMTEVSKPRPPKSS